MTIRTAEAYWEGSLKDGKGKMSLGSGALKAPIRLVPALKKAKGPTRRN